MDNMRNSHRTEQRSNNTVLFLPNQKKKGGEKSGSYFINSSKSY